MVDPPQHVVDEWMKAPEEQRGIDGGLRTFLVVCITLMAVLGAALIELFR